MAYRTKYQLMEKSVVTDKNGDFYPDLATFPLNRIRITSKPREYQLAYVDIYRFFDLMNVFYNDFNFYDYLTLWLNDITEISDENNIGKTIMLYGKSDIDKWYVENMKSD